MLGYLGRGERDYYKNPTHSHTRNLWEIEAVIKGPLSPVLSEDNNYNFRLNTLWIFPPEVSHGWIGVKKKPCEVLVFHFESLPEILMNHVRENSFLSLGLNETDIDQLNKISKRLDIYLRKPNIMSPIIFNKGMLDVSLLVMEKIPIRNFGTYLDREAQIVNTAATWYSQHMAEAPEISDIAYAVNCSVSHLRRLFISVKNSPPQKVIKSMQIKRSKEMLTRTRTTIQEIAFACGYTSQSSFTRSFKNETEMSPRDWRNTNFGN